MENKIKNIYECVYLLWTNIFLLNKNMLFNDKQRLIILYLTFPLLMVSYYRLSIYIYTKTYTFNTLYVSLLVILSVLVISYFSQCELYFDIDDIRRYLIIGLVFLLFIGKILLILNEYQLWNLLPRSTSFPIWNFTL